MQDQICTVWAIASLETHYCQRYIAVQSQFLHRVHHCACWIYCPSLLIIFADCEASKLRALTHAFLRFLLTVFNLRLVIDQCSLPRRKKSAINMIVWFRVDKHLHRRLTTQTFHFILWVNCWASSHSLSVSSSLWATIKWL